MSIDFWNIGGNFSSREAVPEGINELRSSNEVNTSSSGQSRRIADRLSENLRMSDNFHRFVTYDSEDMTDNTFDELERRVDLSSSDLKLDQEVKALISKIEGEKEYKPL